MKRVITASLSPDAVKSAVDEIVNSLTNVGGVVPSQADKPFARKYKDKTKVYALYIFDNYEYKSNLDLLAAAGYDPHSALKDNGNCVRQFMDKLLNDVVNDHPDIQISVDHKLSGAYGIDVWDNVSITLTNVINSATTSRETLSNGYYIRRGINNTIIDKSRPYDDADYYWADHDEENSRWKVIYKGKVVKYISDNDIDSFDDIVEELEMVNSGIKPIMVHN